jgi:hypothetical protein
MRRRFEKNLAAFDAYAKPAEDFRVRTHSGGLVTLVAMVSIIILVLSEFSAWLTIHPQASLLVDPTRKERMSIHLNITFPKIPCIGKE